MKLRKLFGTTAIAVAVTGALYGTATGAPANIDSGSAGSGSASGSSDDGGTLCGDGTVSPSTGPGTCSHHGGEQKNQGHVHHGGGGHGRR